MTRYITRYITRYCVQCIYITHPQCYVSRVVTWRGSHSGDTNDCTATLMRDHNNHVATCLHLSISLHNICYLPHSSVPRCSIVVRVRGVATCVPQHCHCPRRQHSTVQCPASRQPRTRTCRYDQHNMASTSYCRHYLF